MCISDNDIIKYYQELFQDIPCTMSRVNSELEYQEVNIALSSFLGLENKDFKGKKVGFMNGNDQLGLFLMEFFADKEKDEDFVEIPVYKGKVRNIVLIKAKKTPCKSEAVLIGVDITENKAETDKSHAKSIENAKNIAIRDLLHDISNPLTCINYAARKISEASKSDPEKFKDLLDTIQILEKTTATAVQKLRLLKDEVKK